MHNTATNSPATPLFAQDQGVTSAPTSRYARFFFVGMASLFPVLVVLGFTPSYLAVAKGPMTLHWFAHVHGALMTGWLGIFFIQSLLAAKGNLRFHRQLGLASVPFGGLVWISLIAASARARLEYPPPLNDMLWDILLVELYAMGLFGLFLSCGILLRKKHAAHKRLVLFATLVLMQAAIDRMFWLPWLRTEIYVKFIYLDALLIPLIIYDFITERRIHKTTLIAGGCLIMAQLAVTLTWGSPTWHRFWFDRLAPFVEPVVEVKLTDAQIAPLLGNYGYAHWHVTVSRQGDTLYLQLPELEPFELAATSDTEMFMKDQIWKVSFIKDSDGNVIKLINNQPRGVTWELPRY